MSQVLTVKSSPNGILVSNTSTFDLESIRIGEYALPKLRAKQTQEIDASKSPVSGGRLLLEHWQSALQITDRSLSEHHLITAGVLPDAVEPGMAGDPESSINVKLLRLYQGDGFVCAEGYDGVCGALVAYASRYLQVEQLSILLQAVPPDHIAETYPPGYEVLEPAVVSVRHAFERQGHIALAKIDIPKLWLLDRGIHHPELFKTLKWTLPDEPMPPHRVAKNFKGALSAMETAYLNGHESAAVQWSLEAWRLKGSRTLSPSELRFICSGFDAGAAMAIKAEQYVAGFGYLRLLSDFCPDTTGQRERFALWFSGQAAEAFADLRLEDARVMFERAHFFQGSPKTRSQWADTLAELAILRFREGHYMPGRAYLNKAAELAPYRPKVLAAQDADPGGNKRAKIGIMIVICFLGFFAIRRLRHVWFGDLTRVRRTRR